MSIAQAEERPAVAVREDYNPMKYDIMRETAVRLGGRYLHLADIAETEAEEAYWVEKDQALFAELADTRFDTLAKVEAMQESLDRRLREVLAVRPGE